jgi:hypothetical protein
VLVRATRSTRDVRVFEVQRMEDVQHWFEEAGLAEVELKRGYNGINAKGKRLN